MPPAIRALLVTDLVDSTRLVEALGDARAAEVFAAHDRVVRDLLRAHDGREIDRTDGFLLLFETASDAARHAIAYHRAVAKLGRELDVALVSRAGLHVGEVILRENEPADVARGAKALEVEGLAKPVAARTAGLAQAGQTLVTAPAREALRDSGLRVQSHGHWRLTGVAEPMEVFEVGDDASAWQPPPDGAKAYRVARHDDLWVPRREIRSSLPAESDAFVGREQDLGHLARLVHGGARLVTLIGPGGTGKTRLARRFAWTWLGDYPGGAWHCDLSEARSMDGICSAVARALDVPLGKDDPVVQLGHAIAGRGPCLVILDNFEQVSAHAAGTVGRWVERAREAVFLVTSRERLALPTEHLVPVEPLPAEAALHLFEARARAQDPKFAVTDAHRADVAAIVQTLDCLPLAIELAAARIRVLPPATLRERLKERFKVLAGARGVSKRQETLLAAIDWSWDLLSAWEKAALAQASVFVGGFTLGAAEKVLDLSPWPEAPPVMDVVQSLLDKSLLRTWTPGKDARLAIDEPYFGMYVSIHEYAAHKLHAAGALPEGASGEAAERAAFERHGRYFTKFGTAEAVAALDTHGGVARRQSLALELENLVAACRRATDRGDCETAVAVLAASWSVIGLKGPIVLGVEMGTRVLGLDALQPAQRARVLLALAAALWNAGRTVETLRHFQEALAIYRAVGDRRSEGVLLRNLGGLHQEQGRMDEALRHYQEDLAITREVSDRHDEGIVLGTMGLLHAEQGRVDDALRHYQDALAMHRKVGDRRYEGIVLGNLGILHRQQGRAEEALRLYQDALAIAREIGDHRFEGIVLGNLGILHAERGRVEEALRYYEDALAVHRDVGNRRYEGVVLGNVGNLHARQARRDEALLHYQEALAIHREVGDRRPEGIVLGNLGFLCFEQGRVEEALRHYQDALAIHREAGSGRFQGLILGHLGALHASQGQFEEARTSLREGEALLRAVGGRSELAKLLCGRGECERLAGDLPSAREQLAAAEALARELTVDAEPDLGKAIAKLRAALDEAAPPPRG